MIPGGNLLNLALTAIQKQPLQYYRYTGRTVATNGDYVPAYASPVTVYGSIQPVKRSLYSQLGLNFQKNYHYIYAPQNTADVQRTTAGDQFTFGGATWQVLSNEPWFQVDGWTESLCVQVS